MLQSPGTRTLGRLNERQPPSGGGRLKSKPTAWNSFAGVPRGRLFAFDPGELGQSAEVEPVRVVNGGRVSLMLDLLGWRVFPFLFQE